MKQNYPSLLILIFAFYCAMSQPGWSQCYAPPSADCSSAVLMCGFEESNPLCCQNDPNMSPSGCNPLCPGGGSPGSTNWWSFTTRTGRQVIEIYIQNCLINGSGIRAGIWEDCSCASSVACKPQCLAAGHFSLVGNFIGCKQYYLFVDNCNGDVCSFCVQIGSGKFPDLPNPFLMTGFDKICPGSCGIQYSASSSNDCVPFYKWTLDGADLGVDAAQMQLDFPDEGSFILCVEATIGSSDRSTICKHKGPICKTILVAPEADRYAPKLTICDEQKPFLWNGNYIFESGEYRFNILNKARCCSYDSVLEIDVLPVPDYPNIYHLGCDTADNYIDPATRKIYKGCQTGILVPLRKSTNPYRCDSAYYLYTILQDYRVTFREYCDSGKLILMPEISDQTLNCHNEIHFSNQFSYKWYLQSDSLKRSIDTNNTLILRNKNNYCLELNVRSKFGELSRQCVYTYCEELDESVFDLYEICPEGNFNPFPGDSIKYRIDTLRHSGFTSQNWTIEGGQILTRDGGKDTSEILVVWDPIAAERYLCYQYTTACGESQKCCERVRLISGETKLTDEILGFSIMPNPIRGFFVFIGDGFVRKESLELYDCRGNMVKSWIASDSGKYDVSDLIPGLYFIRVRTDKGSMTKKVAICN